MAKQPSGTDYSAIADRIDQIAPSVPGARGRELSRLAAQLRGEEPTLTPNEERAQARLAQEVERSEAAAEAAKTAAAEAGVAT